MKRTQEALNEEARYHAQELLTYAKAVLASEAWKDSNTHKHLRKLVSTTRERTVSADLGLDFKDAEGYDSIDLTNKKLWEIKAVSGMRATVANFMFKIAPLILYVNSPEVYEKPFYALIPQADFNRIDDGYYKDGNGESKGKWVLPHNIAHGKGYKQQLLKSYMISRTDLLKHIHGESYTKYVDDKYLDVM